MAFLELAPSGKFPPYKFDAEKAFRTPIGAASPLWLAFAGAVGMGVAFWGVSRLLRGPQPKAPAALPPPEPVIDLPPEPVVEAEAAIQPAIAVSEAVPAVPDAEPAPEADPAPAEKTADLAMEAKPAAAKPKAAAKKTVAAKGASKKASG